MKNSGITNDGTTGMTGTLFIIIIINGIYIAPYVASNRRALYNTHNRIKLLHIEGNN